MQSMTIQSPSKINLTLDVLSLREDGFHSVATVMQSISLADEISLSQSETSGIRITCSDLEIPTDERNLAHKAASAIIIYSNIDTGVDIHLDKFVPSQAGLGGGSSNAAYTLLGMNKLYDLNISNEDLARIAASLGSDVPFFIRGGTCVCRGRGELVKPLPDIEPIHIVVVRPDAAVSTPRAYQLLDTIPDRSSARNSGRMVDAIVEINSERIISTLSNDFEPAILPDQLNIALAFDDMMMARAINVRLCGSGSAVFGVFPSQETALTAANLLSRKYSKVFPCRTLSRLESGIQIHE
ncbi:MAG: 4-(cytidine 5'-diphospho)-2-C-methyl-D-erythritol kinase [Chthonomonadales bacterium]